jgi:hypothetical protein
MLAQSTGGGLLIRSVTYSTGVSLDGYSVGPDGGFDWTAPDNEVFRFVTDEIREVGVHLLGRRLYETMLYRASAGWISNPAKPAPSARESSISATARRASRAGWDLDGPVTGRTRSE